jgi:hypothetical protein
VAGLERLVIGKNEKKPFLFKEGLHCPLKLWWTTLPTKHPVAGITARFYYICWKVFVNAKTGTPQKYTEYFAAPCL